MSSLLIGIAKGGLLYFDTTILFFPRLMVEELGFGSFLRNELSLLPYVNYPPPKGSGLPVSPSVALDYSQVLHQVHRLFP
jgi:hypothetical protein